MELIRFDKVTSKYMRRGIKYLVLIGLTLALFACGKSDDLNGIQMPIRYQFEVPAGLNPLNTHFFERSNVLTNAEQIVGANDDLERIIPFQARMTSLDNVDFGFIREIEVRVRDPRNPNLEIPAFYREEIPTNTGQSIDLIATQADITDILQQSRIDIIVEFKLYGTTGQTFTTDAQLTFLAQ